METPPKYEIFISYRRDGGVDYARMIYLELKGRGYNTFFDFNSLRSGKFNENIFKAIDECRYFILVLSNGSLDRCLNEDDWVRHEIEYALSKGKEIIPICPSGSMRGFPDTMPESFEPLRHIQISRLEMDDLFDKSFDKIVEDRFDADFREGRSPIATGDVVTVRSFKKIGIGVIAAIVFAAVAIGAFVTHGNAAAERRAAESRRISEEARERAEAERKVADEAKERAREETLAVQREKIRLEAEAKAKADAEEELRKAREEQARLAAEAEARAKADAERKALEEAREKERERAEAERKALEEAREKERERALAAQREKIRLEEEAKAKAAAEEELRKAREEKARLKAEADAKAAAEAQIQAEKEARIRAEAQAQAIKNSGVNQSASAVVKSLEEKEANLKDRLAAAEDREKSLTEEVKHWEQRYNQNSDLPVGAQYRVSLENARASLDSVKKLRANIEAQLTLAKESKQRVIQVEQGSHAESVDNQPLTAQDKEYLENALVRIVEYHHTIDALGNEVRTDTFASAKLLEETAIASLANPTMALERVKEAESAYKEILDSYLEKRIDRINQMVASLTDQKKWSETAKLLEELRPIDSTNERLLSAIEEASGHINPTLNISAYVRDTPDAEIKFYVDGAAWPAPFSYSFLPAKDGSIYEKMGECRPIDIDIVSVVGNSSYSARFWLTKPTWGGITNIVVQLQKDPDAGTSIQIPLVPQDETALEMVWCPPGEFLVPFIDPETDEVRYVNKSHGIGFWISRTEMTEAQWRAADESGANAADGNKETGAFPVCFEYDELNPLLFRHLFYYPKCSKNTKLWFYTPTVEEWACAALYGGSVPSEDDMGDYAWFLENSDDRTFYPVGKKKSNPLGLFDMFGNVPEWTSGAASEWIGLEPKSKDPRISRFGGGCLDDYEGVIDFAKKSSPVPSRYNRVRDAGKAGTRLVGKSSFRYQQSQIEWLNTLSDLDSGDAKRMGNGLFHLVSMAKSSLDPVLAELAGVEYARRGGDIVSAEIPMTEALRFTIVASCTNEQTLAEYAMNDPADYIREKAYEKIKNPSDIVMARYYSRYRFNPEARSDNAEIWWKIGNLRDQAALAWVATNSPSADLRNAVIRRIQDSGTLKTVALGDKNEMCVYTAIQNIRDRRVLAEIRKEAKKKSTRAAARDRLEELSNDTGSPEASSDN